MGQGYIIEPEIIIPENVLIYFREIELFELEFAINKRILFHKRKLYRSRKELQTDLDTWIGTVSAGRQGLPADAGELDNHPRRDSGRQTGPWRIVRKSAMTELELPLKNTLFILERDLSATQKAHSTSLANL